MYNGGGGNDTLVLGGDGDDLDLRDVANTAILGIEKVDMQGGGANILTVTRADVLALSNTTDILTVLGDPEDQLVAIGFKRIADFGDLYQYQYKGSTGTALIRVEADVQVFTSLG